MPCGKLIEGADMDNESLAGFCGDYCCKCPNFGGECGGCVPADHMDCRFVACCLERGLEHCGLCEEFPCRRLREFVPDDRPGCEPGYHILELRKRASIGTAAWLESQRRKWRG
jgi:hypothetical protein